MRIAVVGPQNTGKSTFIKDFLGEFPSYQTPKETYRDVVKKKNLPINQLTTEDTQRNIRDFLYTQIVRNKENDIIFDRCVIDNFIYTCAQAEKGIITSIFLEETRAMMFESLKGLDVVLFIPTTVAITLVNDEVRDIDPSFIDQVNRLFIETLFDIARRNQILLLTISGSREARVSQVREKLNVPILPRVEDQRE